MPFGVSAPPPLPQPPPAQGITGNAAVDLGVGGGWTLGTNLASHQLTGDWQVNGLAFLVTMLFNGLKKVSGFDQHRWAEITLVILGLILAVVVALIAHADLAVAIPKGGMVAWQALQNFVGQKSTGLGGLASALTPGDG